MRPTVLVGGGDVLINNIASVVRRFPVVAVPGSGTYGIQPVYVGDLARICVEAAAGDEPVTLDACGPESFGWLEDHGARLGLTYASELDRHFR